MIWVLYDRILNIDPRKPDDGERDRFLLSKGHGPMAYYAVLAAKKFFPEKLLASFAQYKSPLGQHPDRVLVPGVEIGSGSLGHGLPIATGVAAALRAKGFRKPGIFCLVGDAELDEGSNHEAIAIADRLKLNRLTAIVIDNGSASHGWPGGITERFAAEGWSAVKTDGRNHDEIEAALKVAHPDRPHAVVATVDPKE